MIKRTHLTFRFARYARGRPPLGNHDITAACSVGTLVTGQGQFLAIIGRQLWLESM